ncbi:MAG: N-acetyl-gamma-glutamyl-phosphate reductase [Candidatus Sumerlaeaceae bacterium]|nr:N-acetyl-gamma-glutamyl-phosphate reductase [Candidatus Sumerlaeaceae bacterium]
MTDKNQIKVAIIGATSISAGKLLGILQRHNRVAIEVLVSDSSVGDKVRAFHSQLRGSLGDRQFEPYDPDRITKCDLVFSCKRPGETFDFVEQVIGAGARFVDFSGDFRLKDPNDFEFWYKLLHRQTELLKESVYGLPELYRNQIRTANLVANPGCYTTTAILGLTPIVGAGYVKDDPIIINAISGVSGAGRMAKEENLHINVSDNVRAYKVGDHQHIPEIEQELSRVSDMNSTSSEFLKLGFKDVRRKSVTVLFAPHVGPYNDGIMVTAYCRVHKSAPHPSREAIMELYQEAYANEPFVRVYDSGELPQVKNVVGTNYCDIGFKYDARTETIVVVSVTDNLIKGAAGQAVQNMNIMFGFEETAGLL